MTVLPRCSTFCGAACILNACLPMEIRSQQRSEMPSDSLLRATKLSKYSMCSSFPEMNFLSCSGTEGACRSTKVTVISKVSCKPSDLVLLQFLVRSRSGQVRSHRIPSRQAAERKRTLMKMEKKGPMLTSDGAILDSVSVAEQPPLSCWRGSNQAYFFLRSFVFSVAVVLFGMAWRGVAELRGARVRMQAGTTSDAATISTLIWELGQYEDLLQHPQATTGQISEWLFGTRPYARVLLVVAEPDSAQQQPVGFALYFYTFDVARCVKSLYLEDLYVKETFRNKGIGKALLSGLASIATSYQCQKYEWTVLDWNENSIKFYKSMHARQAESSTTFRLTGLPLAALAATFEESARLAELTFRLTTEADLVLLSQMIADSNKELGHSDRAPDVNGQLKEALFGPHACAEAALIHHSHEVIGLAFYTYNYSTCLGVPGLVLQRLHVRHEARKQGVHKVAMGFLARTMLARGYGRFEWSIPKASVRLHEISKEMGAVALSEWLSFQVDEENLSVLSRMFGELAVVSTE
eukprot:m.106779 g.106779  ORF g.106779 m.106779 type:complete len:523 (-) comp51684_c0_seq7:16-1584(-)